MTFLGEAIIAPQPTLASDPDIGGLSSIVYLGGSTYYAISDDRGTVGPARHYVLDIDLSDGRLESGDVEVIEWRGLLAPDGAPLPAQTFDLEGMVVLDGALFIASEGRTGAGFEPFVAVFGDDGRLMETLGLPAGFVPSEDGTRGVRNNLAFESLAITPDLRYLFTGTESALVQDGPVATPEEGTTVRLLRFDRNDGVFDAQFAYEIDAVPRASPLPGGLQVNGLTELLALSDVHLLALERAHVTAGQPEQSVRLYDVCLEGATDISDLGSLADPDAAVTPVRKRLIVDLADLVPRIDNVEGMTFGPRLPSGERSLIFVSDDNFAPQIQVTQVLAFAVSPLAIRGCEGS